MRVFIASYSATLALQARSALESAGHEVTSTWHDMEFKRTADSTDEERGTGANRNLDQVRISDVLLLTTPEQNVPGGLWAEAGGAMILGKRIYAVGLRPNGTRGNFNMYHSVVAQFSTLDEAVRAITDDDLIFGRVKTRPHSTV